VSDLAALWDKSKPVKKTVPTTSEDLSALWEKSEPPPSGLEAWVRSAHQGATFGFADEAKGLAKAVGDALTGGEFDYAKRRDEERAMDAAAREAHPDLSTAAEFAGAAGSALIPLGGPAKGGATLLRSVGTGAAMGAAQGLGSSEADLTKGDVGGAALDTGLGALVGGAVGAVGHGVGKVVDRVAGRASRGVAQAVADEEAARTAGVDKDIASKLGKYRSAVQSASRDLEVLGREGTALPGQVGERAAGFVGSPQGLAVREQVVANKLVTAPERISEMEALRAEHAAAVAGRAEAIKRATEEGLANPIRKQFAPRLATLGHRLLPAALAGIGGVIGGPEGAAAGAAVGGVVALTQGRPGIILRNLVRSPATRKMLWEFVGEAASSQLLGKFGAMLQRAAQQGGVNGALALHEALMQQSPEYQDAVGKALMESGGTQ
jgi:hypothetical protein